MLEGVRNGHTPRNDGTGTMQGLAPRLSVAVLAAALLTACASTAPRMPTAHALTMAEQAVSRADTPTVAAFAPDVLRAARTKLSMAQAAQRTNDPARAGRLAEQAVLDAELALAKARALRAERDLQQLRARSSRGPEQRAAMLAPGP